MKTKSKIAILMSTVFLSCLNTLTSCYASEYIDSSSQNNYHQKPDGTITGSKPGSIAVMQDLKGFIEKLAKSSNEIYKRAAQEGLNAFVEEPGNQQRKYMAAMEKFNAVVGAKEQLSKGEKKVLDKFHEVRSQHQDTDIDVLIDNLGFLNSLKSSDFEAGSNGEGSSSGGSINKQITIPTTRYNEMRQQAGMAPVSETALYLKLSKEEYDNLITTTRKVVDKGAEEGESVSPKNLVKIFLDQYPYYTEKQRNFEMELLAQQLIAMGTPFNESFTLLKGLHQIRITQVDLNNNSNEELAKQYASFYIYELENYGEFKDAAKAFNAELLNKVRLNQLLATGKYWNQIKKSGEIEKTSLALTKPDYPKNNKIIPLMIFLTRKPVLIFQKSTNVMIKDWKELIPYTPYEILAAISYMVLYDNIDPKSYAGNDITKSGAIETFINAINDAVDKGEDKWKPKPFPKPILISSLSDDDKKDHNKIKGTRDANFSFNSFFSISEDRITAWNNLEFNDVGLFDPDSIENILKQSTRLFKLTLLNRGLFIPQYEEKIIKVDLLETHGLDKDRLDALNKLSFKNKSETDRKPKVTISMKNMKVKKDELAEKIYDFSKKLLGREKLNIPHNKVVGDTYLLSIRGELRNKSDNEIKEFLKNQHDEGSLPY